MIQSFGKKLLKLEEVSTNKFEIRKVLYKYLIELIIRFDQIIIICKYEIAKDLLAGKTSRNKSVSIIFKSWQTFINSIYKVKSFDQLLKILIMYTHLNRYISNIICS
jgi:TRAP-type mannitol/chloroaromatic compound transport system substrate-binding protein